MPHRSEFVDYVVDQMHFISGLRVRAMFGGFGIYQHERMFAIILNDSLYLKSDAITQADFEAHGLQPFTYQAKGKTVTLRYYEAPPEVFDDVEEMKLWCRKALAAAERSSKA